MDNSDHIARKIKEGFESMDLKAPESFWSEINKKLDNQVNTIDEKVKSSFENTNEQAPKGIWLGIDKQLTIDKGWKKIYKYLQLQTFYKWTKRAAALLFLLFFVVIGLKNSFYKNDKAKLSHSNREFSQKEKQDGTLKNKDNATKTKSTEENKKSYTTLNTIPSAVLLSESDINVQSSVKDRSTPSNSTNFDNNLYNDLSITDGKVENSLSINKNAKNSEAIQYNENDVISLEINSKDGVAENSLSDNITTTISVSDSLSNFAYNNDSLMNADLPIDSTHNIPVQHNNIEIYENKQNTDVKKTKFELGITTAINSTVIPNNTTTNSFNETSLVAFVPSFGSNIGLQFVYHIHEKHSLVGNLTHSSVSQAYNKFSNGRYNEEKINVSFIRLQPLYQFSYKRFDTSKTAINIKAGPTVGFITKNKRSINDISESMNYNNFDFGLTLQVGQSVDLNKLVLDYGLNLDKGLSNLNKGTSELPASFNKTSHLGVGAYISLRYKF